MKIVTILFVSLFFATVCLIVFINFSTVSATYSCKDKSYLYRTNPLFITIEKYHPWASLWSSAQGNLTYEIPLKEFGTYRFINKTQKLLHLYKDDKREIEGSFSMQNNILSLNMKNTTFEGTCLVLNTHCNNNLTH